MSHEPRALVGDSKLAVNLMRTHPLLASAQQMDCEKPLSQGNVRVFEDRPDLDGKLLAASLALPHTGPHLVFAGGFRPDPEGFAHQSAMRADRAIGPKALFQE